MNTEFRDRGYEFTPREVPLELLDAATREVPEFEETRLDEIFDEETLARRFPSGKRLQEHALHIAQKLLGQEVKVFQNQLVVQKSGTNIQPGGFHIDGARAITFDEYKSWAHMPLFQLVVGIPLVDLSQPGLGNLCWIPGAHHKVAKFIWENWENFLAHSDLQHGFREVSKYVGSLHTETEMILAARGDIYAFHALLPHGFSQNSGPTRPIWYFRVGIPTLKGREAFRSALPEQDWS